MAGRNGMVVMVECDVREWVRLRRTVLQMADLIALYRMCVCVCVLYVVMRTEKLCMLCACQATWASRETVRLTVPRTAYGCGNRFACLRPYDSILVRHGELHEASGRCDTAAG